MNTFDVYKRLDFNPVSGSGNYLFDEQGNRYLDLYGGHAVITVGHCHPHFIARVEAQLNALPYYSNSIQMPIQEELAKKLGECSDYGDYGLFLCNSGAEAMENALKLAGFHTGRHKLVCFEGGFHGRTCGALSITDNAKIRSPLVDTSSVEKIPLNDRIALGDALNGGDIAAVVIEGIQGIGGVRIPEPEFMRHLKTLCRQQGAMLILDEIQSGYGRSGRFFAHQHAGVQPDLITVAKGMGNGFPISGVLISPEIAAWPGMLGSTYGGNQLACAAGLAVLEIIESEDLIRNAAAIGSVILDELANFPDGLLKEVRGCGLMIGIDLYCPAAAVREALFRKEHILAGSAANPHTLRILPPLTISEDEAALFLDALKRQLQEASDAALDRH